MRLIFSNLDAQRQAGARLVALLTALMVPVVIAARLMLGESAVGLGIASVGMAVLSGLALKMSAAGSTGRALSGVALMAQVSLLVAAVDGHAWQIDMHMTYFAALALLVVYCDWTVIAAAAATVAVHHLGSATSFRPPCSRARPAWAGLSCTR
jgi:methyl-accepting chemotaxis protein